MALRPDLGHIKYKCKDDQNFQNLFITLMVSSVILKKRIIRCASSQPLPYVAEDSRPPQAPTPLLLLPQAGFEPCPCTTALRFSTLLPAH